MEPILVFDLEDTLYDELSFVNSGFHAVAQFVAREWQVGAVEVYTYMRNRLSFGRGHIFDDMLSHLRIYSRRAVRQCLSVYRLHQPDIQLYPGADACLANFREHSLYIVTDGNKLVQQSKIKALGLADRVHRCLVTHRFGVCHAKPSPYCFLKICEWEKVEPQHVVYIADNPNKDFVGIKPLGFKTVRVLTGQYAQVIKSPTYEASFTIHSLTELNAELLDRIFS